MRCAKVKRTELQRPKWQIYLTAPYLCGCVMEDGEEMIFGKCEFEERL